MYLHWYLAIASIKINSNRTRWWYFNVPTTMQVLQ